MKESSLEQFLARLEGSKLTLQAAARRGVHKAGLLVEGDAKNLCPVDTGQLRNSISTQAEDTPAGAKAQVGTNVAYAPYVEFGTGQKGDPAVAHREDWLGSPPHPFLRPAFQYHLDSGDFQKVIGAEMKGVLR